MMTNAQLFFALFVALALSTVKSDGSANLRELVILGENTTAGEYPYLGKLTPTSLVQERFDAEIHEKFIRSTNTRLSFVFETISTPVEMFSWDDDADGFQLGQCQGSLIAPDIVLTAAHCSDRTNYQFNIGAFAKQSDEGGGEARFCVEWYPHEAFNWNPFHGNDIALCKLDRPIYIDDTNTQLEINRNSTVPENNEDLIVMGVGQYNLSINWYAENVLDAVVPYVNNSECNSGYGDGKVKDYMLCAGFMEGGLQDSCFGDSGGPLVKRIVNDDDTITHIQVSFVVFSR